MSYYAILVPAYIGHLNPMIVLAGALQRTGEHARHRRAREARRNPRGLFLPARRELEIDASL